MGLMVHNVTRPFFPDITPPTAPVLDPPSIAGSSVSLSWSASTDLETGVVGYVVMVDGFAVPSVVKGLAFTVTALSVGQHTFQVAARDGAGNVSALSNTQTAQVGSVIGTATKLIRGNGFWFDNQFWNGQAQQTNYNAHIDSLLANPYVDYIQIVLTWPFLEGAIRGDYTAGFAIVDSILAKLKTQTTRKVGLILKMWQTFFNTQSLTSTNDWPQYVVNNQWVQAFYDTSGNARTQLKFDIDDVWTALTNMFKAYGARYNGDDHFLMMGLFDETTAVDVAYHNKDASTGVLSGQFTAISATNYNIKYKQMCLDVKASFPNTLVWVPFNYLPPGGAAATTAMIDMITTFRAAWPGGFIFGGPDPATNRNVHNNPGGAWLTTFQNLITGFTPGLGDLRGIVPLISHVEEFLLGNKTVNGVPQQPPVTPAQLYSDAVDLYKAQVVSWNYETWEYYKAADQLAAIAARSGITAPLPTEGNFV